MKLYAIFKTDRMEWIMKRRFGMWMGILLILIIGVSVTKMTRDFVVSQGVEASSILYMADAANFGAVSGGSAAGDAVPEKHFEIQMAAPAMAAGGTADGTADGVSDMEAERMEAAAAPVFEEAIEETMAVTTEDFAVEAAEESVEIEDIMVDLKEPVAGMTGGPGAAVPGVGAVLAPGGSSGPGMDPAASAPGSPAGPGANAPAAEQPLEAGPGMPAEQAALYSTRSSEKNGPAKNEAAQKTVKSPLDPAIEDEAVITETEEEINVLTAEDFFVRFVSVEETIIKIWDKVTADNPAAYNAAAEQERVLWDYELNLIYGEIRSRMTEEEAEKLKHLELEWLKTRDQYAERTAAKTSLKNVQKQDPVYIRALAEKTKERCYWLAAEYEELLNQENLAVTKKN